MANYDIMTFLEYYDDRANVFDSSTSKRTPSNQWQNFYQEKQQLTTDNESDGDYLYLAFDAQGYGSTIASAIGNLTIDLAATSQIIDITNSAIAADNLIIASLYIQNVGSDNFDAGSAQQISRYIGSIEEASLTDESVQWTVNPAINKLNPQVPSRFITEDMMGRFFTS
jgi:hypothetical protein